ncbi:MAG: ribosome biogenesis GTPase YlqF [Saccharofermentanales bacterium]|nr:ribosome biogenesis GTPase YlqF [Bacillota bacterium]
MKEINWFPGHMAKSRRELLSNLTRAELILEVCDARVPNSSRHPDLDKMFKRKPVWTILGKADLADPFCTERWLEQAVADNAIWLALNILSDDDLLELRQKLLDYNQQYISIARRKGKIVSPLRIVIVGIPNSGKSTLINRLIGRKSARTSNKPGVTRNLTWIRGGTDFEVLDTPGILPPRLDTIEMKRNLAAVGAIPDEILPIEEVSFALFRQLAVNYPDLIKARFGINIRIENACSLCEINAWELFQQAALKRNCLASGGEPDLPRFNNLFLQEFRSGKIGRVSLECPQAEIKKVL